MVNHLGEVCKLAGWGCTNMSRMETAMAWVYSCESFWGSLSRSDRDLDDCKKNTKTYILAPTNGPNTFHTVSANILCPSGVGCIPSSKFNAGIAATPSRRNGTNAVPFSSAKLGNMARNSPVKSSPILGGASIPTKTIRAWGNRSRVISIIA